jgi:protein-S-isoprenylcysteine O-methyltransferase Ste14
MKATQFEFRFRILIAAVLYVLGLWAPWTRYGAVAPDTTTWLAVSTTLARWGWLRLDQSTMLVTGFAMFCTAAGALLRIGGTSYLGATVVSSAAMHGETLAAAGPYRFVRNPLYLGTWIFSLGVAILMPPSGALVFLVGTVLFYFRLILGEEDFLAKQMGLAYEEYRRRVPRIVPRLRPRIASSGAQPNWLEGVVAECYPAAFALCLAALAWRYQPLLLIRCLVVCFGISLVARAILPRQRLA